MCVLSLAPDPPALVPAAQGDKAGHLLAYFSLGAWFTALARGHAGGRWLALVALGLGLEGLQGLSGGARSVEVGDVLANLLGIAAGALFSRRVWPGWLHYADQGWARLALKFRRRGGP